MATTLNSRPAHGAGRAGGPPAPAPLAPGIGSGTGGRPPTVMQGRHPFVRGAFRVVTP
jgi:hypothetical protein